MKKTLLLIAVFGLCMGACKKKEFHGKVWFSEPTDKAELTSPIKVGMQVEGMKLKPAGDLEEGTGHFHILVNKEALAEGGLIPTDAEHLHFGAGQAETSLELKPGDYSLTLQFADGHHVSYGSKWSQTIKIKVKDTAVANPDETPAY